MSVVNCTATDVRDALISSDFIDSVDVGFVLQDATGAIVDCNRAAAALLGLPFEQVVGRTSHSPEWGAVRSDGSPFPGDEHPAMVALRTGCPLRTVIMGIDIPGRSRRWILVDAWPIISPEGVTGVITSFDDQTERVERDKLFRALARINELVIAAHDEDVLLSEIADCIVEHLGYPRVEFVLNDDAGSRDVGGALDPALDAVTRALRDATIQVVDDVANPSGGPSVSASTVDASYRSLLAAPVSLGDQRAVLAIYGERRHEFDALTIEGVAEIAKACEYGVAHVRSMERLEMAFDSTLAALAGIGEMRDPYTAGHQSNVGVLSEQIAVRLGLDDEMVGQIRRAAEVHDIGKIAVPAEILTKPGRLSALEYEMMKVHARIGWEILSRASLPWPIAEVALQHHERLDGSGYPQGLAGEAICLPARVVAVADVIEAMIQHRPYRPGLGRDVAIAEVLAGAGVRYDADAVAAAVAILADGFDFTSNATLGAPRGLDD